jgi:hypothetical protein
VLITLISVLLFLGYARAGAWLPEQAMAAPDGMAVAAGQAHAAARPAPPRPPATRDEWWQHVPAAAPPPPPAAAKQPAAATSHAAASSNRTAPIAAAPYNPATAPTVLRRKPPVRPWWEQER